MVCVCVHKIHAVCVCGTSKTRTRIENAAKQTQNSTNGADRKKSKPSQQPAHDKRHLSCRAPVNSREIIRRVYGRIGNLVRAVLSDIMEISILIASH